ncbi:MAG: prohibitin family protein [Heliobacteriaceae bacterium]|jgi:regulator of protease activity HflC (stomatin/prohibitin superfamily)|nr:prohibitin family protein [Heliobacteriaceae bacterium]
MKNFEDLGYTGSNKLVPFTVILVVLIVFVTLCNPIAIVGAGERGVKVTLGKVSSESYAEGVHFVTPFIQKMKNFDVRTQKVNRNTQVYTKDIQQAGIDYVLNYNIQPANTYRVYREIGTDYEQKVISPITEGTIKDVIGKWNAQDLVANREKATAEIQEKLGIQLKSHFFDVTDFNIVGINYSSTFEHAIEAKVTAEQEALKAKNKTVQIEEEAKQKLITAQAEARSMSIRANALTQNRALVQYEAVQKWDGKLPQYMMGNSVPFINLSNK